MEAVEGVEIEQLAAVHVDVDAGFALADALRTEGLEPPIFAAGEIGWKLRLADGGEPLDRYRQAMAAHQDRIARPIDPLDDDLDAWVIFLRCYQEHRDPFDMLGALGIGLGDVARLGRRWTARLEASPRLAKRALKVADRLEVRATKHREKARLPLIQVGEARLVPSPAAMRARRRARDGEPTSPPVAAPELTLDAYAAMVAALRVAPPRNRPDVLARLGLSPAQAEALDAIWQQKIGDDALLRSDFRVLCRHFEEAARLRKRGAEDAAQRIFQALELPFARAVEPASPAGSPSPPAPGSLEPAPAGPVQPAGAAAQGRAAVDATSLWSAEILGGAGIDQTGSMPALVLDAVLPFIEGQPALARPAALGERAPSDLDGTSALIPALLDADVLPFAEADLDATAALDPGLLSARALPFDDAPLDGNVSLLALLEIDFDEPEEGASEGGDLGGTSIGIPAFRGAALPFERAGELAFAEAVDVSDVDPFGDLSPTAPIPEDAAEARRPPSAPVEGMGAASAGAALADDLDATATFVRALDAGSTFAPALDDLDATSTFVRALDDGDLDTTTAFVAIDLDLPDERAGAPSERPPEVAPRLTMAQYASLTIELERWPEHEAAIVARYGLTDGDAEHRAWVRLLAAPAERARFDELAGRYRAWLAARDR